MTIQQAIEKAIEGGFSSQVAIEHVEDLKSHKTLTIHDYGWVFVREDFWMSLGKAMGWRDKDYVDAETHAGGIVTRTYNVWTWRSEWHRFIDHLAEGKDAESFFETL